jgi:hypothetical protein
MPLRQAKWIARQRYCADPGAPGVPIAPIGGIGALGRERPGLSSIVSEKRAVRQLRLKSNGLPAGPIRALRNDRVQDRSSRTGCAWRNSMCTRT